MTPSLRPEIDSQALTPPTRVPLLVLTQGDPAGIGPEILLGLLARWSADEARRAEESPGFQPLAVIEGSVVRGLRERFRDRFPGPLLGGVPEPLQPEPSQTEPSPRLPWDRLRVLDRLPERDELDRWFEAGEIPVIDPVGERRRVEPGVSGNADADGALAALDVGIEAVTSGVADALVTAPVSKASIARRRPGFTGHTDYLAERAGLGRYGRDYLMAFLGPDLQVALLSTHLPLREALDRVTPERLAEALDCLHRHAGGRIAVAGFDPHAGEGGLLGSDDQRRIAPAVAAARERGLDVAGPESADSVFARARRGEFDWVLALYHDQGLIAVKTSAFGRATNWTLGLPYLRTSVDHGTAFELAGRGLADIGPLEAVVATTQKLLTGELPLTTPRGRRAPPGSSSRGS